MNPATGEVIRSVRDNTPSEVDEAVEAAKAAFESGPWPRLPRSERARHLLRCADAIEANSEVLFRLETQNNGRPLTETKAQLSRVRSGSGTTRDCWPPSGTRSCPETAPT
ncbi:Phenylacetaldehyde dehydrogenase [Streptomyces canarius]